MGWRSWIKSAVRQVVRVVIDFAGHLTFGLPDFILGFVAWPPKKLRLHVAVLSDASGPLVTEAELTPSIDYIQRVFKDRFNVKVVPYSKSFVQVVTEQAPTSALVIDAGWDAYAEDFDEAGDFFAKHLAGWNVIPVGFTFPVTVYVIRDIRGRKGYSLGPLTDYVLLDVDGVRLTNSTLAHEVAHACTLVHSQTQSNLMYARDTRGDGVKGFQKNFLRSSRHMLYW